MPRLPDIGDITCSTFSQNNPTLKVFLFTTKMPAFNIVVFGGDHCGPEVTAEAIKVLKVIADCKPDVQFEFDEQLLGGCSIDSTGSPLTEEALNAAKSANAVLLGAIGGPKWGTGKVRPEQGILKLRKELGTFGNLRPCFFISDELVDASPLKAEVVRGTNFTVVRELTGGIYFGDRQEADESSPDYAWDTEPYSKEEITRITRLAAHLALAEDPPVPVWSLDKANVLATSRLWRRTVTEVMQKEFPKLKVDHQLIDSAAMKMVKNPRDLNGIVVTSNLFGDIITDEASVIPGSLGLLPSASLSGIPDGKTCVNGIYEPIHGSAPDISGKGIVNPVAAILSVSMMLKYSLCLPDLAAMVDEAVRKAIAAGYRTPDLSGKHTTAEVGNAVADQLKLLLS
ncbi:3-isopropylmalate dehydrogenase Leu2A [Lineolata rhizophorae]|uniref:3-isopropylmalate dehydrogenase n=1 Tax=Lineolata rhizophorae TaxID=578093 RepID=A0A6A6PD50_9PEZI|nr:3-isopropylmalate dehydrogenase Leu2A [Lineolata rhizophorae]